MMDQTTPNTEATAELEKTKPQPEPESEESEEEKIDYDGLFTNDIFYSCVYVQYCRKPGASSDNMLSKVNFIKLSKIKSIGPQKCMGS